MKPDLKVYRDHLRAKGHPAGKKAYLFPIRKAGAGGGKGSTFDAKLRKWHRDIEEIAEMYYVHEKIRQAGIRKYFHQSSSNSTEKDRIKETAEFAGCSEKWVEIILSSRKREEETLETKQEARQFSELRKKVSDLESLQVPEEEIRIRAHKIVAQAKRTLSEFLWHVILKDTEKVLSKRGFKFRS
jgi:hypothetical protein